MKRLLSIFGLLTATLMVIMFVGCGGDEEEEVLPEPTVNAVSVAEGSSVAGNTAIVVTFSRKVDDGSVTISVTGAAGTIAWDPAGKVATWTPTGNIPAGAHTLSVGGTAADGQSIGGTTSVNFTATAPDTTKPTIVGASCDPKNGATGVDPSKYTEKIVVVFSEDMNKDSVKINKQAPEDMKVLLEWADAKTLNLMFQKYSLGNEVKVEIEFVGKDNAGNDLASGAYSFTTMAKEQ